MAFTYDYNVNLQAYRLTPITKRQNVRLNFLYCIGAAIQRERDVFFDDYLQGNTDPAWDVATNYVRGDVVNYQNRIYECTNDIIAELPTNRDYWVQITADFRGATERIKYNCQTLMITWVLNRWFDVTFVQPALGLSDIYIVNNTRDSDAFVVAESAFLAGLQNTSFISEFDSGAMAFIGATPVYVSGSNFTVYYPVALIPTITDEKYFQMTGLVDKYKLFGTTVDYISY